MEEGGKWLRARSFVSSWIYVLAVGLAVAAVVGGAVAYTAYAAPGTTTERTERTLWSIDGEFEHGADVVRENPVFDVGTRLSDRSTYFLAASPVLDGSYALTYSGGGTVSVTADADLVVRSVGEDGTVYWSDRTRLNGTSGDLSTGDAAAVGFSVNASRVAARLSEIQSSLGQTPGESEVFVTVDAAAEGAAESAALSVTHRLPISVEGDTFTVGPEQTEGRTVTTTETETTPREYGPLWSLGGPLLILLGAGGGAAMALGQWRDAFALSEQERAYLSFTDDRAEFDEWIVSVRLPSSVHDRPQAEAESLADLVDFAIDADAGVVEDPDTGHFYVVTDAVLATYEPPSRPAANGSDDSGMLASVADASNSNENDADPDGAEDTTEAETADP